MSRLNEPLGTTRPLTANPAKSAASMLAIVAAIASFYFSSRGQEFIGLFAAVAAIGAGLIGGAKALSPNVRGGSLSIAAVALGVIAVVVALVALVV